MEKMICSCCGAAIVPNITQAFLTCEYCDTSVSNPHYNESAAAQASQIPLEETCIAELLKMGEAQQLSQLAADCFGKPIHGIDSARAGLSIPDAQQVYFLYAHNILLLGFSDGLALTDSGLYYCCDAGSGNLPWSAFVTSAISCADRSDGSQGTLKIGSAIEIAVKSDKDSRLARFLVDFHNHVYQLHTGNAAPAAWAVTEGADSVEDSDSPSLLGTVLPAVGSLLLGSATRRQTVARRTPTMHPTSHPTVQQDRRNHVTPPRPLHSQPHRHGGMNRPGGQSRPGMGAQRPGNPGRHGMQRGPGSSGRPGGMGGPGRGRR